jgi:hypothetical protein
MLLTNYQQPLPIRLMWEEHVDEDLVFSDVLVHHNESTIWMKKQMQEEIVKKQVQEEMVAKQVQEEMVKKQVQEEMVAKIDAKSRCIT